MWQHWLDQDPLSLINQASHAIALKGMKLVYLDCGNRDEYTLHYGARQFCQRLTELDIPYTYDEFDGGHRHTAYRYDESLKAISDIFSTT